VYALGVTLYECLTGAVPHEGDYGRVLQGVFNIPIRRLVDVRDDVPPTLGDIVHRCLARAPQDRFQTMKELCTALGICRARLATESSLARNEVNDAIIPKSGRAEPDTIAATPKAKVVRNDVPRRKHPRAAYTSLARIEWQGETVDGRIEEVSEGGLQFVGARAIPAHESVTIRFSLPVTGRVAQVTAAARWTRQGRGAYATGFELADIDPVARAEIRKYVAIMCPEAA
jgi:serine/threonine protein kinase